MTITFAIFHGSRHVGTGLTASSAKQINEMLDELNSIYTDTDKVRYTATIVKVA